MSRLVKLTNPYITRILTIETRVLEVVGIWVILQ